MHILADKDPFKFREPYSCEHATDLSLESYKGRNAKLWNNFAFLNVGFFDLVDLDVVRSLPLF